MLQKLLGSQGRAEILKNLFTPEHKSAHLRQLARLSGISAPVLLRELNQLVSLKLVVAQRDGNRVNFSANVDSPLFNTLCELVLKTEGAAGILKEAFADSCAFSSSAHTLKERQMRTATSTFLLLEIADCVM